MGSPIQPELIQEPEYTPEQWRQYLLNARTALHQTPNDQEALQAIRDATEALNAFEQPAITAGERAGAFESDPLNANLRAIGESLHGMGQAAVDIPVGMFHLAKGLVTDPVEALQGVVQGLKQLPGEIASGDPRRSARALGNVYSFRAAPQIARGVAKPFRAAGALMERPIVRNRLLNAAAERAETSAARGDLALRERLSRLREEVASKPPEPPIEGGGGAPRPPTTPVSGTTSAMDVLRNLPDEALGETPPLEMSAANPAAMDALIAQIAERMVPSKASRGFPPEIGQLEQASGSYAPTGGALSSSDIAFKGARPLPPMRGLVAEAEQVLPEQGRAGYIAPEAELVELLKRLGELNPETTLIEGNPLTQIDKQLASLRKQGNK